MTDLEKRAEEYLKAKWGTSKMLILGGDARKVLADFAQSETNRLSRHILDLHKDKGELTDRVRELEAQIEKMKCCQNCDNWNWKHSKCEKKLKGDCFKQSKWILRR